MNKFSLLVILLTVAFTSCSKKNEENPRQQIKLLIKVVKKFSGRTDSTQTLYEYDGRNHLKTMILLSGYARAYTYDGDDLLTIEDISAGIGSWRFYHENNVVSRGVYNSRTAPAVNYTFQYRFNDGKIVRREGSTQFTYDFTYSGHNVASWTLAGGETYTYQRGTYKNPYYNPAYKYLLLVPNLEGDDHFSENNPTMITKQQNPFLGSQISYVMYPDGLPASATIRSTVGKDPNTFSYTYETYYYKLFDVVN